MALHQPSGRARLGFVLAASTAICWATLPIALKIALARLDPLTLTWARFVVAAGVVGAWLAAKGDWRALRALAPRHWLLLGVAALMLTGNYVFYLLGVKYTTPANAQLLIQAAPLLMALGGIFVFGERYNGWQWLGFGAVIAGLALFSFDQTTLGAAAGAAYAYGSAMVGVAALVWAIYALIQKQLLNRLSSATILGAIYVGAALVLLPMSAPASLETLEGAYAIAFAYCALNTLVAYGAFAEALAHWEASRVSAVLALTPLLTVATAAIGARLLPELVRAETIGLAGWSGAALAVAGSALSSLAGRKRGNA